MKHNNSNTILPFKNEILNLKKKFEQWFSENHESLSPPNEQQLENLLNNFILEYKQNEDYQAKYHNLYNFASIAYLTISQQGLIIENNSFFEQLMESRPNHLVNKIFNHFIHTDDSSLFSSILEKTRATEKKHSCDLILLTLSGKEIFVHIEMKLQNQSINQNFPILMAITKVKDKKMIDEKHIRTKDTLDAILQTAPVPIFTIDPKGRVQFIWNSAAENLLGWNKKEILGKPLPIVPHERQKEFQEILHRINQGERLEGFETLRVKRDGTPIHIRIYTSPIYSSSGHIKGHTAVLMDITKQKKDHVEKHKFKTIIDNASYGISILDDKGRMTYVNKTMAALHGYAPSQLINRHYSIFHSKKEIKRVDHLIHQLKEEGNFTAEEVYHIRKDGTIFPSLMNGTIIKNDSNRPVFLSLTAIDITHQKKSDHLLQESQQWTKALLNAPTDVVVLIDRKGIVYSANETAYKRFKVKETELIGQSIWDFLPQSVYRNRSKQVENVFQTKQPIRFEDERNNRWNDNILFPVFNEENEVEKVAVFARDITERKESEKRIANIAADLKQIIERANIPIFSINNEEKIIEWNKKSEEITGFLREEVINKLCINDLIKKEYQLSFRKVFSNSIKRIDTVNYELPLITKDGRIIIVLLNTTARRDINGNVIGIICMGQDITELTHYRKDLEKIVIERTRDLKKALAATEESMERSQAILKSVADGLIVTDKQNHVIMMNKAAEDFLGVDLADVVNKPIDYAIREKTLREKVEYTFNKKTTGYSFDFELFGTSHREKIMRARTSIIRDKEAKPSGIVTIINDVTQEREIDRMKTEFLTTAAHELRTPLTSIRGFSEILMTRDTLTQEEQKRFISFINNQSVSLSNIINELLDIARIESGRGYSLKRIWMNPKKVIQQTIPYFENQSLIHSFEILTDKEEIQLFIDAEKIEQVLKNLISNAVKYSPEGGLITIQGGIKGNYYQISITDQGIGMDEEQVNKIFDKFYRADASNSAIEGTGLGMTIVRYIVEAHNGDVYVKSKLGKGTTVRILLPINIKLSQKNK